MHVVLMLKREIVRV